MTIQPQKNRRKYLKEVMSEENDTGTPEFFEAFEELYKDGFFDTPTWRYDIDAFYKLNRDNIACNASKEIFVKTIFNAWGAL